MNFLRQSKTRFAV